MAAIPIQSLSPDSTPPSHASIRAVVTLSWPYSSSTRQCALLLADPDFRLRNSKGQVRVRFTGPSAEAVAKSHVGIGDEVLLDLEGAQWEAAREVDRTPGKSVEGELVFRRRLGLRITSVGEERYISLDAPASPPPSAKAVETPVPRAMRSLRSSLDGGAYSNGVPIYSSPAFAKRLRLSAESSSFFGDTAYDPFVDDDELEGSRRKTRGRRSLGEVRQWRFADRTPSPENSLGLDGQMDVDEPDADAAAEAPPGTAISDAHAMAPSSLTLAESSTEQPNVDSGHNSAQPSDVPSLEPTKAMKSALALSPSTSAGRTETLARTTSSAPGVAESMEASLEDTSKQVVPNPASASARFSQAHPSYDSDTEEDEELYTRTPPRVKSASPSQHTAAQNESLVAQQETFSLATPPRPSPASQPVQTFGSKPEHLAPQESSSSTYKASTLPTQTPTKLSAGAFAYGVPTPTTPLLSLSTTPQSEKDRVMSQTFKSLFGFRTSPEAQPPLNGPAAISTPTPKTAWSNMGRTSLDDQERKQERRVPRKRSPAAQQDVSSVDTQLDNVVKPSTATDMSQHEMTFEATVSLPPGGSTEIDTEADEELDQPERSAHAEYRHEGSTLYAAESDEKSPRLQNVEEAPTHATETSHPPAALTDPTNGPDAAARESSPLPDVPHSSHEPGPLEAINADSSSDVGGHAAVHIEAVDDPLPMVNDTSNQHVGQQSTRNNYSAAAASGDAQNATQDHATQDHATNDPRIIDGPILALRSDMQMADDDIVGSLSVPSTRPSTRDGGEHDDASSEDAIGVVRDTGGQDVGTRRNTEHLDFTAQLEQAGVSMQAHSSDVLPIHQFEPLQDQPNDTAEHVAFVQSSTEQESPNEALYEPMGLPVAEAASKITPTPPRDTQFKPAARSNFELIKFPSERVIADSQWEEAGMLSTQQPPEEQDGDEAETFPVPAREVSTSSAQGLAEGEENWPREAPASQSVDEPNSPASFSRPTVIELDSSSSSSVEGSRASERQPHLEQPPEEHDHPSLEVTGDAMEHSLEEHIQAEQTARSPQPGSHGDHDDQEDQTMDMSSTAPVPSDAPLTDVSRSGNVDTAAADETIASLPSEALTDSINDTQVGSQEAGTISGSSDEKVIEGRSAPQHTRARRTDSPEQFWHLPGGMVATFSNSALLPRSPLHSELQHEGPNVTPWGETLQGGMDGEPNLYAIPSTPGLTQPAGSTTHIESSLRTSRAASEVNDVVSNISTELSMEAQLEPEVQAHKQILDKWNASGQRTAAMLGLMPEETDDETSNEPLSIEPDIQSREEAQVTYPVLPETALREERQEPQSEPENRFNSQVSVPANLHPRMSPERQGDMRAAETVEQESASAAEPRKMPSRKSLRARLSNVPDVISAWFSPRSSTAREKTTNNEEANGHSTSPVARSKGEVVGSITPPRLSRDQSTGFTTSNGYFTALSNLEPHLNPASQSGEVDILAVVTDFTSQPQRAKRGPRDYYTVCKISDSSLEVDGGVRVEVFRPWKAVLPVAEIGDVVLLRGFVVKSKQRQPYLLSADGSAWCVWRYAELARTEMQASDAAKLEGRPHVREEIHGPPVEFGDEERAMVRRLRHWFEETYPEAAKGPATNSNASAHEDTVVHDGDDEMAYQPMSPAVAARL